MIHTGDCIEVMATLPTDSVDAVVTDPPYGLEFMGKSWDGSDGFRRSLNPSDAGRDDVFGRASRRSPEYRAGRLFGEWCEQWGREALRVTRPGGYLLAFGGTRTHHRLVCGLEDAGWLIRDELDWIYASGFPKGKANLKPAHEPIVLARKPGPLRPLGIDECRIGYVSEGERAEVNARTGPNSRHRPQKGTGTTGSMSALGERHVEDVTHPAGRWPSNLLLSSPELFDEPNPYVVGSGAQAVSGTAQILRRGATTGAGMGYGSSAAGDVLGATYGDSGGYSRFFIIPKADRAERERGLAGGESRRSNIHVSGGRTFRDGEWIETHSEPMPRANVHPTVKPIDLMRHLVRLVTPPGGTVLDPFLGSGTTAIACDLEGVPWIGIEREPEYVAIAEARLLGTQRGMGLHLGLRVDAMEELEA